MMRETDFLIIGAGPFGLSMAAYAKHHHIDHLVVGRPMDFWKSNMPKGMFLRSGLDWHLDPLETHTIEKYLDKMKTKDGFPVLDEHFQTNIPGLFMTSMSATRDFGAFFAFTVSVNASAKIIGSQIAG